TTWRSPTRVESRGRRPAAISQGSPAWAGSAAGVPTGGARRFRPRSGRDGFAELALVQGSERLLGECQLLDLFFHCFLLQVETFLHTWPKDGHVPAGPQAPGRTAPAMCRRNNSSIGA